MQIAHHLAAVAGTQREGVAAIEKSLELIARTAVEQDGLGPALSSAEHVAIGKSTAGHEPLESGERHATGDDVAHVHVARLEAGAVEGRGHFDLAVHSLLAQDRHLRARAAADVRRGNILRRIEGQFRVQSRIRRIEDAVILLLRALRVVAQHLQLIRGLRPRALQCNSRFVIYLPALRGNDQFAGAIEDAETMELCGQPGARRTRFSRRRNPKTSPAAPRRVPR